MIKAGSKLLLLSTLSEGRECLETLKHYNAGFATLFLK